MKLGVFSFIVLINCPTNLHLARAQDLNSPPIFSKNFTPKNKTQATSLDMYDNEYSQSVKYHFYDFCFNHSFEASTNTYQQAIFRADAKNENFKTQVLRLPKLALKWKQNFSPVQFYSSLSLQLPYQAVDKNLSDIHWLSGDAYSHRKDHNASWGSKWGVSRSTSDLYLNSELSYWHSGGYQNYNWGAQGRYSGGDTISTSAEVEWNQFYNLNFYVSYSQIQKAQENGLDYENHYAAYGYYWLSSAMTFYPQSHFKIKPGVNYTYTPSYAEGDWTYEASQEWGVSIASTFSF